MWLFALAFFVAPLAAILGYIPWLITTPHSAATRLAFALWYAVLATGLLNFIRRAWRDNRRLAKELAEENADSEADSDSADE
jgi:hypothetical protein